MIVIQRIICLSLLTLVLACPTIYGQANFSSEQLIKQHVNQAYDAYFKENNPLFSLMKYAKGAFEILDQDNPSISIQREIALRDSLYLLIDTIFHNEAGTDTHKGLFALLESHYYAGLDLYYQGNKRKHDIVYGNNFLQLCEKSKALFLKVSNTLEEERGELLKLRRGINTLENKKSNLLAKANPSYDSIRQIDNEINELMAQVNDKTISKRINPQQQQAIGIRQIQERLSNDEALISYNYHFTSPEILLTLLITKDTFNIYKLTVDVPIKELVRTYQEGIRYHYDVVAETGSTLYELLFKAFETEIATKRRLLIVKDEVIEFLPLEALPYHRVADENQNYAQLPYLVNRHSIVSLPSISTLMQYDQKSILGNPLLVAPIFDKKLYQEYSGKVDSVYNSIPSLISSLSFLKSIDRKFRVKILKRKDASTANIRQYGTTHNFIHFDTHTFLDQDNLFEESKIVFAPNYQDGKVLEDFLSLNDVFEINIAPDVLVLGSCNTGVGRHELGEGIISIGYNFHLLGIQCIMYSSWSLEENSTHKITELFYQNLSNSTAIDYALQQAKIEYLKQNRDWKKARNAAPYYWSGMSVSGMPVKVKLEKNNKYGLPAAFLLVVGIVLGISFLYWYNKK